MFFSGFYLVLFVFNGFRLKNNNSIECVPDSIPLSRTLIPEHRCSGTRCAACNTTYMCKTLKRIFVYRMQSPEDLNQEDSK
ncbi:hypothetical protein O6H91_15G061800 [Diphasiastrum complanatum]|uniref:Uncharacterized protein n=1 Tax=Diphasiastrum complanatum TaxID=34168 RepID=A0ACC2BIX3_DIPCM|nr:hypothetical protein O6H91_15G061800 [Diphasiastrum complanatum]